ncbi:MAG: hypothetical protein TRG1_1211 [Flavobacteriaceae bacterium FS1-H7996/R]|nr:MAG: hypothetical protein TRG1_1211 [Flavobacteriaceae bacterium FS1-H7996/R]
MFGQTPIQKIDPRTIAEQNPNKTRTKPLYFWAGVSSSVQGSRFWVLGSGFW